MSRMRTLGPGPQVTDQWAGLSQTDTNLPRGLENHEVWFPGSLALYPPQKPSLLGSGTQPLDVPSLVHCVLLKELEENNYRL